MAKKGFLDGYRTYDPEVEGFGNPSQWRAAFKQRMSREEAQGIIDEDDPWAILGLSIGATKAEIKKAYIRLIKEWHPDKNPHRIEEATKKSQKIIAAYTILYG